MGRPAITVKYPFAPLAALMGMTEYGAAKALGMDDSAYCGYKRDGMSELVADRMAQRAGFVAYEIWPELLREDYNAGYYSKYGAYLREQARKRYWADVEASRAKRRARYKEVHAAKVAEQRRLRYHNDPEYRESVLQAQRVRDGQKRAALLKTKNKDNARNYLADTGDVIHHENTGYKVASDQQKSPDATRSSQGARGDVGRMDEQEHAA